MLSHRCGCLCISGAVPVTMLREEWDHIAATDCEAELDGELDLLCELQRETCQLIACAKRRRKELQRAALAGRLRRVLGGNR